jgi:Na+/melibiose symporter-like transporter
VTTKIQPAPGRRDLRLLVGATGVSTLGDFLALIPLALYIQAQSGSGLVLACLFISLFAPAVLFAGPAGLIVDRFENRRVVIVVSLLQIAVAVALAFVTSIPVILALTALMGTGFAIAQPAEFALLPHVAGEARMTVANGHMETARYLGMTAGPLLGGALAAAGGTQLALLADAGTFALVALAALALHARRAPVRAPADGDRRDRARDGIAFLFGDRTLALIMLVAFASLVFMTASATAEVFFATDVLGAGDLGYGVLMTAWTLGMVLGAVVVARRVPPGRIVAGALVAVVFQGIGLALPTVWLVLGFALGVFCVGGIGHATKNVLIRTLIHERVPDALRGRAFAAYSGLRNGAELIALAGGGLLVSALGARTTLFVAGAGAVVAGLAGLAAHRALGRRAAAPSSSLGLRAQPGEAA